MKISGIPRADKWHLPDILVSYKNILFHGNILMSSSYSFFIMEVKAGKLKQHALATFRPIYSCTMCESCYLNNVQYS